MDSPTIAISDRELSKELESLFHATHYVKGLEASLEKARKELESKKSEIRGINPLLMHGLTVLNLKERTLDRLSNAGVWFVWQVARFEPDRLPEGIGKTTYEEIRQALIAAGIWQSYR